MAVDKRLLKIIKNRMQYTDEETQAFCDNPSNENILSKYAELKNKQIVAEIIVSKGCNSRHKVGTKIYLDGEGNLLQDKNPSKLCIHLLKAISPIVNTMHELFYTDVDPNRIRFNRGQCIDVGIECGGWGRVVVDVRMEDIKKE